MLRSLVQQTARVPWDDRRAHGARVEDLREAKVREYLRDVRSGLLEEPNERHIYQRMRLTVPVNDHEAPRNVERAADAVHADPRALHEFAQTKMQLAAEAYRNGRIDSNRRFLREARPLLERVIQLDAPAARHAWAWRDLARALGWLRAPVGEVEAAYRKAIELLPDEPGFVREMDRVRARR